MKKLKIIKKYWVKKQNDDIQSIILLCTFGSLKWESKEGNATEEIREIIKSLANRKDLVTKFPNSRFCPCFFCNANPNQQGQSGFTWMTTLETHTPGKDVHVWEKVKQQKGPVLWSVLDFSPKCGRGKQGDRKEGGEKGRGALHQMCINQHKRCISLQPWSTSVPVELLQLNRHLQNYFLKKEVTFS